MTEDESDPIQEIDFENSPEDSDFLAYTTRETVSWDNLVANETYFTEVSGIEEDLIEERMGYVPLEKTIFPHLPFIRATVQRFLNGQISEADYRLELDKHMDDLRSADMEEGGWLHDTVYGTAWHHAYETKLLAYKDIVVNRLTRFLGYKPKLEHSLAAEMFMRERVANPDWIDTEEPDWLDYRMMTVIHTRQALFPEAASSPVQDPSYQ